MNKFLILLFIFSILACNEEKKNLSKKIEESDKVDTVDFTHSSKQYYVPLFMDLNPKMPDVIFENRLNALPNKQFIIPLGDLNKAFDVKKHSDRIVLSYSNIRTLTFPDKFGEDAEARYEKFLDNKDSQRTGERMIGSFINIFQEKYPYKIENLPLVKNENGEYYNPTAWLSEDLEGIRLLDYNFEKENYVIFQDSIKTIIVGYTNLDLSRKIDQQFREIANYDPDPKIDKGRTNPFKNSVRDYLKNTSSYQLDLAGTKFEDPLTKKIGYELEVNYMFNSDFKVLEEKIIENYYIVNQKIKAKDSLAESKNKAIEKNLQKL